MGVRFTLLMQLGTTFSSPAGVPARLGGWSESHYKPGGSIPSDYLTALIALAAKRAAILPKTATIVGYRVSLVDVNVPAVKTGDLFLPGNALYPTDVPQMGLKVSAQSQFTSNKKELELRGIPDGQVTLGEFAPSTSFKNALQALLDELQANWCFRGKNLTSPTYGINFIDDTGVITLINPAVFALWDQIQVLRTKNSAGRQKGGLYQIVLATGAPNVYRVANWNHGLTFGGKVRATTYIYPNYFFPPLATQYAETMVKKVGRPFNQYRGRKSVKSPG